MIEETLKFCKEMLDYYRTSNTSITLAREHVISLVEEIDTLRKQLDHSKQELNEAIANSLTAHGDALFFKNKFYKCESKIYKLLNDALLSLDYSAKDFVDEIVEDRTSKNPKFPEMVEKAEEKRKDPGCPPWPKDPVVQHKLKELSHLTQEFGGYDNEFAETQKEVINKWLESEGVTQGTLAYCDDKNRHLTALAACGGSPAPYFFPKGVEACSGKRIKWPYMETVQLAKYLTGIQIIKPDCEKCLKILQHVYEKGYYTLTQLEEEWEK